MIDYTLLSINLLRKYDLEEIPLRIEELNNYIAEYGFEFMDSELAKKYGADCTVDNIK